MRALYFSAERREDRDAYVATMRRAGHTLQEIGDTLGVTRERVRVLAKRAGAERETHAATDVDPIAFLRFARSRECGSFGDCARRFGVSTDRVGKAFREIGVARALLRLYRWRRYSRLRATIIAQLQAFVAEHGRVPITRELHALRSGGALPHIHDVQRAFGSLKAMWAAAGIAPRPHGTPSHLKPRARKAHCKRGHEFTAENTYTIIKNQYVARQCRTCWRARARERYAKQRATVGAA